MHEETLRKETVLGLLEETIDVLEHDDVATARAACEELAIGSAEWTACRAQTIEQLQGAEEWAEREEAIKRHVPDPEPVDSQDGPDYVPSHAPLALFQSAMDEYIDREPQRGFSASDPKWLSVVVERLKARFTGKAPFVQHAGAADFRFALPERGRVALVSDWGTGNRHAVAVAQQIASARPHHVIHLGDVYYSGTPREMQRHFFDVWAAHGPRTARYWALNANHDMYCGGQGYFGHVLPRIGQPASYFSLSNAHWRFVALDTAYVDHNLTRAQVDWLDAQASGPARTVLLTHHHLISPFRKPGYRLEDWLRPFFDAGRIYGWFWGHDHHLVDYGEPHGVRCRCIGHGGVPRPIPPERFDARFGVRRIERRPLPDDPTRAMHGFALLTLDGPGLQIDYVDQEGGIAWSERWD